MNNFSRLHPKLQAALDEKGIISPSIAQSRAIPDILAGRNVLLVAPTGIGKTEAAVLPIFHRLLETEGRGIKAIYITPLRALNRDMMERLAWFGERLGVDVAVRHGDTTQKERNRQSAHPPDLLITTPETLQILFTGKKLREHLKNVRWVVIDEIHELAGSERGAQLSVGLERLVEQAGDFQRIGLSATVGNTDEVADFLGGYSKKGRRGVKIVNAASLKDISIRVTAPEVTEEDEEMGRRLQMNELQAASMRLAKEEIERHKSTLFFVNTRDTAEALGVRYHLADENFPIGVHHGSLSKDIRIEMEKGFKSGNLKALICTSSLELGIDVGSADFVIQYSSPRQATRLIQRVGRSGHKIGKKSEGIIIATKPDDVLESAVIARRTLAGEVENIRIRENPKAVLANQIVAMAMAGENRTAGEAHAIITRAYPFRSLPFEDFKRVLEQLVETRLLYIGEKGEIRRKMVGLRYFYENISMIADEKAFFLRDAGSRKIIGKLDDSFVTSYLEPYATFITHGRSWRVVKIEENEVLAEEIKDMGATPCWLGEEIPVPLAVAREVGRLRTSRNYGDYFMDERSGELVKTYLSEHEKKSQIPTDTRLTLESGNKLFILNAPFGSRVNETLGRLLSTLVSARLGESVGMQVDPYRVILDLPRNTNADIVHRILKETDPDKLEALMKIIIRNSPAIKWLFVNTAKKFGAIRKDADTRSVRMDRLLDLFDGSVIMEEAIDKFVWERLDIENTADIMKNIRSGEITVSGAGLSPIGLAGLEGRGEMMVPKGADASILRSLKERLERERIILVCLNCGSKMRTTVEKMPERPVCRNCGGRMLTLARPYTIERIKVLSKKNPTERDLKEIKAFRKSADLIRDYGKIAVLVMVGRGIGPDTAARILATMIEDEYDLLRKIMAAEINYARTKQFWD